MKTFATAFIFLLVCTGAVAQAPLVKEWDKRFGGNNIEEFEWFQQTKDGGFILGGSSHTGGISGDKTQVGRGYVDYWIVKIDSLGTKQWDKRFGGTSYDYLNALQQTTDGGYILGGATLSGIGGDKTQDTIGGYDCWIIKLDSAGVKQWDKDFGGTAYEILTSIQQTPDGGYILGVSSGSGISGHKTQASRGGVDYWIVKIDSVGIKQWDKGFGGTCMDQLLSLQQTTDGGYILGGYSCSGISGDKTQDTIGGWDYWVVKLDSAGTKQWDKNFGGADYDYLMSLQQTRDGGYILEGYSESGIGGDKTQGTWGSWDFWIIKLDSAGNKQWDKDFGGWVAEYAFGNVSQTADGGFLIPGSSTSPISGDKTENNLAGGGQIWAIKTDSLGNKQWDKTVFTVGSDIRGSAIQTKDGCYAFGIQTDAGIGGYKTQGCWGYPDYWIIKFCDTTRIQQCNLTPQTITANQTAFCANDTAQICAPSGFANYQWNNGATTNCIYTSQAGNYNVTVTDNTGCTAGSNHISTTVYTLPTANISADTTIICASDTAQICAPTGFTNYLWNNGATTNCISTSQAGNYYLTVTDGNGCTAASNHLAINVYPQPPVSISVSGDTLTVYNAMTQQWYLNGSVINGATSNIYIATQGGSYTVMVTDSNGCAAISSPVLVSGIENISEDDVVSVFPNPSQNTWQLTVGNNLLGGTAEVFDANGRVVFQSEIRSLQSEIAPDVARGVYLLRISSAKSSVVRKLIRL